VARAYSHYWHSVAYEGETRSFDEAVEQELAGLRPPGAEPYVKRGFYSEPLGRYLDAFGDNVHVLFLEELTRDPAGTLRKVFEFLEVDDDVADRVVTEHRNAFKLPRGRVAASVVQSVRLRRVARSLIPENLRPRLESILLSRDGQASMTAATREVLEGVYLTDADALRRILGRPLPWARGRTGTLTSMSSGSQRQ
jgi:hypothetical protein